VGARFYVNMSPTDRHALRLVVQHVWESSSARSSYRIIAYSNDRTYRPVEFESLDDLLRLLGKALPEFDVNGFPKRQTSATSILFADEMELTEAQLSILGLRP
jgi:hypothetical protein